MINFILLTDKAQETVFKEDISGRPVSYVLLTSTPSPDLQPYGLAAAWQCGDREFGWKIYTTIDGEGLNSLWEAIGRFSCTRR
jgi:hypothetical protein